jgi:hypothetical protein
METKLTRPSVSENSTIINMKGKCYLYGGKYIGGSKQLCILDLQRKKWEYTTHSNTKQPPYRRAGHTCSRVNDDEFVIFGGQLILQDPSEKKKLMRDI